MNIIDTALPLPAQVMVEFFKNKKTTAFRINYEESLKNLRTPQAILNYIANLKLVCELNVQKIPQELFAAYVIMRDVVLIEQFVRVHANVLYFCKYGEILNEDVLHLFDYDDIATFVQNNTETVAIQMSMLDSLPLYLGTRLGAQDGQDITKHELVNVVDTEQYPAISVNLFQLFRYELFLIQYLEETLPLDRQIYFKTHFENAMYGGMMLYHWFATRENPYFLLYLTLANNMEGALNRFKLAQMYGGLLSNVGDDEGLKRLAKNFTLGTTDDTALRLTRKEMAALNRMIRKDKKRAKVSFTI